MFKSDCELCGDEYKMSAFLVKPVRQIRTRANFVARGELYQTIQTIIDPVDMRPLPDAQKQLICKAARMLELKPLKLSKRPDCAARGYCHNLHASIHDRCTDIEAEGYPNTSAEVKDMSTASEADGDQAESHQSTPIRYQTEKESKDTNNKCFTNGDREGSNKDSPVFCRNQLGDWPKFMLLGSRRYKDEY